MFQVKYINGRYVRRQLDNQIDRVITQGQITIKTKNTQQRHLQQLLDIHKSFFDKRRYHISWNRRVKITAVFYKFLDRSQRIVQCYRHL